MSATLYVGPDLRKHNQLGVSRTSVATCDLLGVGTHEGPPQATIPLATSEAGDHVAEKGKRSALDKLPSRTEEGRKIWSVPIPEPKSKVRAVSKPVKLKRR